MAIGPGTRLGPYEVREAIGAGRMGKSALLSGFGIDPVDTALTWH